MSDNHQACPIAKFCFECHVMYGSPVFDDMCSKCWKKKKEQLKKENKEQQDELCLKQITTKPLERAKTEVDALKNNQNKTKEEFLDKHDLCIRGQKDEEKMKKNVLKCNVCSKKIGILGYNCKHCCNDFCKVHRLPEDHKCEVDFVTQGRKKLKLDNPFVGKQKIQKI